MDAAAMDAMDAAPMDAAPLDAAPMDAAPMDAAPMDAMDAAPMDAMDAAPMDAAEPCAEARKYRAAKDAWEGSTGGCMLLVNTGSIGMNIDVSLDPMYTVKFKFFTGVSDAEQQAAGKLREGMVLTHVNGVDQEGIDFDAVCNGLQDRPCKLQFVVSEVAEEAERALDRSPYELPVMVTDQQLPKVDFDVVYRALEQIDIPVNESRMNVKLQEQQVLRGMCIGCVNARSNGVCASTQTYRMRYLTYLLVEFARRALPKDFAFTSIQVNKNYVSAMHVDKGNMGPSYIVGVGDYTAGKLWIHRQKYELDVTKVGRGRSREEVQKSYMNSDGFFR
jgi:hypothetical protein